MRAASAASAGARRRAGLDPASALDARSVGRLGVRGMAAAA
jgi:hypothetical protein